MKIKYCPKCGCFNFQSGKIYKCDKCKFTLYFNPAPAVELILRNNKGEILLATRGRAPKLGYLDLPGGFVENNESAEQALFREINEELGINIKSFKYFGSSADLYPYKGIDYHTTCFVFYAKMNNPKIKVGDDVAGAQFYNLNKLDFKRIATPRIVNILKKLL